MSKINVNTANFSAFFSSNSNLSVNQIVRKNVITSKAGCNQIIRSLTENRVFFIIPNSYINNTCEALNRTFEQVIEEFSLFNFKYRIHTSSFDFVYDFLDKNENVKDSTIIEINLEDYKGNELDNIQHRYYAFCLIRHFYYYQNLLKYYFDAYNDDDDLTMKMIKFSAAYEKSGPNHTLFCSGINDISACPISVINDFVRNRSNSPENYRVNTSSENLENYSIEKIIEKRINDFYYKDIFNIDTPFVLISREMSKLLPKKVKSQIVPDYYFTRIGYDHNGYIVYFMLLVNDNISKYLTKRRLSDIPNYNSGTTIDFVDDTTGVSYSNLKFHKLKGFYNIASNIKDLIHDFNFQLYNEDLEIVNQQSNKYYIDIKSRHPSHNVFRKSIKSNRKVLVRFGSTTPTTKDYDLVINNERAIENSSDKYKMKTLFTTHDVITAEWTDNPQSIIESENNFPVIAKHIKGSRGTGE